MLASGALHLRLGAPLARIFVSWIFSAQLITPSFSAGDATFVPILVAAQYNNKRLAGFPWHLFTAPLRDPTNSNKG